jgi:hypothetical protein
MFIHLSFKYFSFIAFFLLDQSRSIARPRRRVKDAGGVEQAAMMRRVRPMKKKGSSPDSGEGGPDFEEEVVIIPEAVGSAFDHLDRIIDPFKEARVQPPRQPPAYLESWQIP